MFAPDKQLSIWINLSQFLDDRFRIVKLSPNTFVVCIGEFKIGHLFRFMVGVIPTEAKIINLLECMGEWS